MAAKSTKQRPPVPKRPRTSASKAPSKATLQAQVATTLAAMQRLSTKKDLANLARFGITASQPLGVSMANLKQLAKRVGKDHDLAQALWATGCYEARMLAALIGEPGRVTPAQMDRWCRDFDNWAVCDTLCFHLFDRTPHAWDKVRVWGNQEAEFVKRAGFALLASLALHDKLAPDARFVPFFPLIERGAADERNFVKKGVSWALRGIGRRNAQLRTSALRVARRLADSDHAGARWVGKDALRDLERH